MMTFFSIFGLESFVKGSDTQPGPSTANRKDIESWDKKSKTLKLILCCIVDSSIKHSLCIYNRTRRLGGALRQIQQTQL
jgi:hypothetical protein